MREIRCLIRLEPCDGWTGGGSFALELEDVTEVDALSRSAARTDVPVAQLARDERGTYAVTLRIPSTLPADREYALRGELVDSEGGRRWLTTERVSWRPDQGPEPLVVPLRCIRRGDGG